MTTKKYYYVTGNTANGLVNFLPSNIEGISQIIILKHPSNLLKTNILKKIINRFEDEFDLEVFRSALGNQFLEGVVLREKSFAIITDTIASEQLNAVEIDLTLFQKQKYTADLKYEQAKELFNSHTQQAYNDFSRGLKIHDELESIFINEMDFSKADELAKNFIEERLENFQKKIRTAHVYHRLFGTNTADGVVNIVPHIIESISHVYHVKGRAGTGKSTFMKKVLAACKVHGYDIELYHCSFDPSSVDMVLVRELDFCIFDSTDPHEFFPEREGETIIDLYEETVAPGTDEKYAEKINRVNSRYKSYMKKGIEDLQEAGKYLTEMENYFKINEGEIGEMNKFILQDILAG